MPNKYAVIYVAGPFRAETPWKVEQNVRRAEGFALALAQEGAVPLCPHAMYRHFDKSCPDQFWLDATLGLLARCDALMLLPGWKRSSGSVAEREWAEAHGMPVVEVPTEVDNPAMRLWSAREALGALRRLPPHEGAVVDLGTIPPGGSVLVKGSSVTLVAGDPMDGPVCCDDEVPCLDCGEPIPGYCPNCAADHVDD